MTPRNTSEFDQPDARLEGRAPTASEVALMEFGKQAIVTSLEKSMEFHKTMLQASATFGALITTLAPMLIWGDKDKQIPASEGWWLLIPPILMLLSSVVFACGYFPRHREVQVNVLEELKSARSRVLKQRRALAVAGMALFSVSLCSLMILIFILRL